MPTIRQLPSGKYQAQVRLAGHKAQSKTFSSREQANSWAELLESQLSTNILSKSDCNVLAIGEQHLASLKPSTANIYKHRLNALSNFFTDLPIDCIEQMHLHKYKQQRLSTVSSSTCRSELQLLSRVLKYARVHQGIDNKHEPFKDFTYPETGEAKSRVLTDAEYRRILIDISPNIAPIVSLAWETAMRRSEILSITKGCIDYDRNLLHLSDTKNGESRDVPLSRRAMQVLKQQERLVDDVLFQVKKASVTKAFKRSCDRLAIEGACFHTLRHTAITRIAKKSGVNTHQLMAFSGHKDTRMLTRYTHIKAQDILHLLD
ncbi:tyrosine-type recombinase/integrase [Vibrio europaeus]|uniref:tyrosine-type recombinase/integrase n=1 Tax=Vibrio europaeus TaxID=300876 RepID=UPI00233F46A4|nr:site-specific integrase [Vibrio europaeus]MDC5853476.1 site-specific integrase [Vibrio europaeus]